MQGDVGFVFFSGAIHGVRKQLEGVRRAHAAANVLGIVLLCAQILGGKLGTHFIWLPPELCYFVVESRKHFVTLARQIQRADSAKLAQRLPRWRAALTQRNASRRHTGFAKTLQDAIR